MVELHHYQTCKKENPGAMLLFRVGDFYELFMEDAEAASRVLGLTITTRKSGTGNLPMAGFPYHQLEAYCGKLIQAGFRIAIVEQMPEAKPKKKSFRPNTVVHVVIRGKAVKDGEEWDIILGEKIAGETCLAVTPDTEGRRGEYGLTHDLTGLNLLRSDQPYEEAKRRGEVFWEKLPDKLKELYRTSDDVEKLCEIPYDLKYFLRNGKFPE